MRIKRMNKIGLGFVFILAVIFGTTAAAQERVVSVDFGADYFNKYVWRGQNIDDHSVLQPSVAVGAFGLSGSIWANMDLTDKSQSVPDNSGKFSEVDYSLDFTTGVPGADKLAFSVGTIHYRFPNTSFDATTEVYGGLSLDVPLYPYVTWYRDVDEVEGSYLQFGLGHTFEGLVNWGQGYYFDLDLSGSVAWADSGYNDGYFGVDDNAFNDLTFSIGLPLNLHSWTIRPSLNMSTMLSERIGDSTYERNNIWFGVGLAKSF